MPLLLINNAPAPFKSLCCVSKSSILERDEVQQHVLRAEYADQPILEAEIVPGSIQIFS